MVSENMEQLIKELPINAKKIFLRAYDKALKSVNEKRALRLAWRVVKQSYKIVEDKWTLKTSVKVNTVVGKSGFFNPSYYMDYTISSINKDNTGESVDNGLLENIAKGNIPMDVYGDIEHFDIDGISEFNGLFELISTEYINGKLNGKITINKKHKAYKTFTKWYPKGTTVGISAEFYNPTYIGKKLVNCERVGWSMTDNPRNPMSVLN